MAGDAVEEGGTAPQSDMEVPLQTRPSISDLKYKLGRIRAKVAAAGGVVKEKVDCEQGPWNVWLPQSDPEVMQVQKEHIEVKAVLNEHMEQGKAADLGFLEIFAGRGGLT